MKQVFKTLYVLIIAVCIGATSSGAKQTRVTIGMQLEPPNLNPTSGAAAAIDEIVYANVFEGLTRYKPDGSIIPALAKSWEISEDGRIYIFYLHENVAFHDGTEMNASDVQFSLDRARGSESTNAQKIFFQSISEIEILDKYIIKITLKSPNALFLTNLAWGDSVIVAKESIKNAETAPIGTGPFKFHNWVKGDRIELLKNDSYWGKPVFLKKVIFKFISEPTAAYSAMLAGDIDAFPVFPAPESLNQFLKNPKFKVIVGSTEGETILAINNRNPPFNNRRIRKAIAHAINREEIIDGAMFGYGTPIATHFAPHHPAYVDLRSNSLYDPELSKKIILEEGFDTSINVTLKLPPTSYARRSGEIVASQLKAVGIKTTILNVEWSQWLRQVFKNKDFNLTIVSHTEPLDIDIYGRDDYYFQYDSDEFKKIMRDFTKESDPIKQKIFLQKAQRKISEDYVNGYLFQLAKTGVTSSKLIGLWENSPTQANDLTNARWID